MSVLSKSILFDGKGKELYQARHKFFAFDDRDQREREIPFLIFLNSIRQ